MQPATRNLLGLFCGALLFHLAGIWILPLIDRDEPRFAEASREMIERGDYIVPYFNDRYRFDKPPLTYWAQVASFHLFGQNPFAARFPSAVAAALVAVVIAAWGARLGMRRVGLWAAIMFTLCPVTFFWAKGAVADMWLVLFVTLAHCAGHELLRDRFGGDWRSVVLRPERRTGWWWVFYLSLAIGFLAKGPIAWVPIATVTALNFFRPVCFFARRFMFVRGILLTLVLVALWGVPALLRTDGEFFAVGIGRHVVGRSFGAMQGHGGGSIFLALIALLFYFVLAFPSFAPWSVKLPWLFSRLKKRCDPLDVYLAAGAAIVFLIFTIVKTKLPHYVLPAYPLLALLLARHWLASGVSERTLRRLAGATAALLLAVALLVYPMIAPAFPAAALLQKAGPFLQPEMDFAAYDFDAPSLVWNFRSRVRGFLRYNRSGNRDVATLQPDQIPPFLASPGPHFAVLPTEVADRLYPTLPSGYRKFSTRGFDIAKVRWVNLTLILKNT